MSHSEILRPSRALVFSLVLLGTVSAFGADAPRPWPPDQFLPVTPERVAALPATEQPAWRAYLIASAERARLLFGELSNERRKGYGWYGTGPVVAIEACKAWRK